MTPTKTTILIVEDEFLIARDLRNILTAEGYDVIIDVDTVELAIKTIESNAPQLVLIDLQLSDDTNGVVLGQYLLKKDAIPFIYVTSHADKLTLERVNETRPYGFIVKPFKPIDVLTTVSIVLNNAQHRRIDVARVEAQPDSEVPYILKNIILYINEHIHEKITVADLTQMTKWKSQHFQRVFTQFMGMNPNEYIKIKKIEKAKALLIETDMSICDIVYDLGYKSQSNFFTLFKTLTGMSPESYRIENKYKSTSNF